jgi:hypothetical protein
MKISDKHFSELKSKLDEYMVNRSLKYLLAHYVKEKMGKDPLRLLCFNVFYQLDITWRNAFLTEFYKYANDDHLFTALKQILNKK